MSDENIDEGAGTDSRRDALKKLGIGAGVAWAAPVAMSFHSAAGAAPGSPPPTTTSIPPTIPGCDEATCGNFVPCSSSNPDCVCISTPQGGFCMPGSTPCAGLAACGPGLTCPPGEVCAVDTCCGDPVCAPISLIEQCPPGTPEGNGARVPSGAGTIGG